MKLWLKGNITIPPRPRSVGGLIGWARGVNRALAELRDRKIVGAVAPGRHGVAHPWKASKTDDTEFSVSAGLMWTHRNNASGDLGDPVELIAYPLEFDGQDEITATSAGYIYALCDIDFVLTALDTLPESDVTFRSEREVFSGIPEVIFSSDPPPTYTPATDSRGFACVIAKIGWDLETSTAFIEKQYVKDDIWPVGGSFAYEPTP